MLQRLVPSLTDCAKAHSADVTEGMSAVIVIAASGKAQSVAIQPDTVNATPLAGCLRNVLLGAKYPKGPNDAKITVPLKLVR